MATVNFDSYLPEGESLFDYQHVGVAYALVAKRCFIADEQGLGKTRQALVALAASGSLGDPKRPVVIVCKASLKGNWMHEVRRCLPDHSVQIVGGRRPYETLAEIVIINYDLLKDWADTFTPSALVLDESHYCKEIKAQRTKAALELADRVPADGLVLLLTGTPLLNRPVELVSQLQIMGSLKKVSPRPRKGDDDRDWEYAFKFTFCGPQHNGHGYEFKGATNLDLLNDRLRSSCYVRRLRHDVLDLSETQRHAITVSCNGALDRYQAAERNLIAFLKGEKGEAAAEAARRAEVLVSLNTLRQLAGEAKVDAAVEWIETFREENPGRQVVVFAWHKPVQKAIAAKVGGIYLAGEKDIEVAKARFNSGEVDVLVCSLQAHREGHTLVAEGRAQDVLFAEMPWHPGAVSQAEDRINRIGRTSEAVFAWTLLAEGADIDNWLYEMIQAKWAIFKAAVDGVDADKVDSFNNEAEESIVNEIIDRFRNKGEAA